MKNKYIFLSALAIGFASCEPEFENSVDAEYTSGEANFSTYVSVGNSLTAGYMDGTVSKGSQANSYPNLLAQQFAFVGGGVFEQPSYANDVNNFGGLVIGGMPIIVNLENQFPTRRILDATQQNPDGSVGAVEFIGGNSTNSGPSTIEISNLQAKAYNNMGVPGAKSFHLLASGYGNIAGVALGQANPYFVRHATSPSATVLGDAMSKNPTFFTNWIGSNDVLSYALSGGVGADHNVTGNMNPATYGGNDITNSTVFGSVYTTILNTLTQNGAKGVVCTIPSVSSIPFFTTVPYNPLTAKVIGQGNESAGVAAINQLNAQLYGPLKQALTAFGAGDRINLLSTNSGNPLLIKDETLPNLSAQLTAAFTPTLGASTAAFYGQVFGQARQALNTDLVLLRTRGVIGTAPNGVPSPLNKYGITYPLEDGHILIPSEKSAIAAATTAFNTAIVNVANSINTAQGHTVVAVADMNAVMNQLVSGLRVENGSLYTANYFSGSANEGSVLFSLDGVHPNARGYAVIANEIIKVINREFKANIPLKNASYYPGINIVPSN